MKREAGGGKGEGFTLVEVLVVLTLLGVMAGISGLALASLEATPESEGARALARARAEAIHSGRPVRADSLLFFPDGSARGPGVNVLTGGPRAQP